MVLSKTIEVMQTAYLFSSSCEILEKNLTAPYLRERLWEWNIRLYYCCHCERYSCLWRSIQPKEFRRVDNIWVDEVSNFQGVCPLQATLHQHYNVDLLWVQGGGICGRPFESIIFVLQVLSRAHPRVGKACILFENPNVTKSLWILRPARYICLGMQKEVLEEYKSLVAKKAWNAPKESWAKNSLFMLPN